MSTTLPTLNFASLIEAELDQLIQWRWQTVPSLFLKTYLDSLYAYRTHNLKDLHALLPLSQNQGFSFSEQQFLEAAIAARIEIRERITNGSAAEKLLAALDLHQEWQGEISFILGHLYEIKKELQKASDWYLRAYQNFQTQGVHQKAIKSLLNHLVCLNNADIEKHLFADFYFVYRQARSLGATSVAGAALMNIAGEYQILGALRTALRTIDRALALMKSDTGSINYFLALVQRAHILFSMDRKLEAESAIQAARLAPFPEVLAALEVLESSLKKLSTEGQKNSENLNIAWQDRLYRDLSPAASKKKNSGNLEESLLRALAEGPKTKHQITNLLYGDHLDLESTGNRFFNLLNRIRKKNPGLIVLSSGSYRLAEDIYLEKSLG